ncbi:membrane protein [Paenibacillus sp. J31TS4]|uniref:cytochrome d ubiquinol oxidase subunit II n=1 Tax=Paenibacillus sp. J31TS4 TaxID=2807195 RepID=UPI001B077D0A|nr:cytochrome d ubiquinol oxidase subunit II [Paenibacillus sp. J31TS4]GIP37289.1 membrane protein [Paenibacillus sp. J31TS4]
MDNSTIAIVIIWGMVFIYSILGSIDFGAGFWAMVYKTDANAGKIANRYLSPSWEVTNVFLVLLVVSLAAFFPHSAGILGTILIVPVCLVLLLLLIRSAFLVYSFSVKAYGRVLNIVSGLTGLLIPGLLVSVLPVTLGGFIDTAGEHPSLPLGRLFSSPSLYAHVGFGLSVELFLSALFLADYSHEAENREAYRLFRRAAIGLGPTALGMALLTAFTMVPEAHWIVENMQRQAPWFLLSVAAFAVGYTALWWKRRDGGHGFPRVAVISVVAQLGLASYAYGAAHMPYIVYPFSTVERGFTNDAMFYSLLGGYVVGALVFLPVFYLFWRLFLKDKRYLKTE